jgi:hypothetical protein
MMTLLEWLQRTADDELTAILERGHAAPGFNGPHGDPETPVRNTSHWAITFARLYRVTNAPRYLEGAKTCADYLLTSNARPKHKTFHHRNTAHKDKCNGLIGQAWSIEALVEATVVTGNDDYRSLGQDVFAMHRFNPEIGLWYRCEVDGQSLPVDPTFNHQLWFAAAASLLDMPQAAAEVEIFLARLPELCVIYPEGLISHPIPKNIGRAMRLARLSKPRRLAARLRWGLRQWNPPPTALPLAGTPEHDRCVGYHAFNTYALAMLKEQHPNAPAWKLEPVPQIIDYLASEAYRRALAIEQTYGYRYNPPGFEVPFSLSGLTDMSRKDLTQATSWWLDQQFKYSPELIPDSQERSTPLAATLRARAYEVARLPAHLLRETRIPHPAD